MARPKYLQARNPLWNLVGRVCFHLAENRRDPQQPFALLATYTTRAVFGGAPGSAGAPAAAKLQHLPLGRALTDYAGAKNKGAILSLLLPVQRAAEKSALVKGLVDSGEVFHPLAWTPREAYAFLRELPVLESSGAIVRVPDWWKARRGTRPDVQVTVGGREPVSAAEWKELLASTDGLALVKGRWVEIDRAKLDEVLAHWKKVERAAKTGGITFAEGMRLLAGTALEESGAAGSEADTADWSRVVAGDWIAKALESLRNPVASSAAGAEGDLRATLRPYQRTGVEWLRMVTGLGLGGCLADDMGLGKAAARARKVRPATVAAKALVSRGISHPTIQGWLRAGVLRRTDTRGVYRTTPETGSRVAAYLARNPPRGR